MANTTDEELNKSRGVKYLIRFSMSFRRQFKKSELHRHSNRNTKLFNSFTIYKRSFCLRRKSYGRLRRVKRLCSRHPLTFAGKTKQKKIGKTVKNELRSQQLVHFLMPTALLPPRFNQTCKAFEHSARALVLGLLASKQRLHGLQRATSGVDKKAPKEEAADARTVLASCTSRWGTFSLSLSLSLRGEFAEGKLADGGRDRVMWTKGGELWKINVVIEEKRVGEKGRKRQIGTEDKDPLCRVTSLIYLAWVARRCGCGSGFNQSSRRGRVVPHGCCIREKRAALRLRLRPIAGAKFTEEMRECTCAIVMPTKDAYSSLVTDTILRNSTDDKFLFML